MQVIPSILENNPSTFLSQIKRLSPYFDTFQIDIADGIFVTNKTVQINDLYKVLSIKYQDLKSLKFDFHLMVKDYEKDLAKLLRLKELINVENVFIHYSLFPKYKILNTKYSPLAIGLVLNPEDSVNDLSANYELQTINSLQIMSVSPGFQGSPFIPETLQKIGQLRKIRYEHPIFLDGGINDKSLLQIMDLEFKPDFLVIGSYLVKSSNLKEKLNNLKSLNIG